MGGSNSVKKVIEGAKHIEKAPDILKNIGIFKETQSKCEKDSELSEAIIASQGNTEYYSSDAVNQWESVRDKKRRRHRKTKVTLSHDTSFTAAGKFAKGGKTVAVLNFANAVSPGGGVKNGAIAQEECLCRSSTLYPVLSSKYGVMPRYYAEGEMLQKQDVPLDKVLNAGIMYHPGIVVFRSDRGDYRILKKEERFRVDVITCAAPDLRHNPLNKIAKKDEEQAALLDVLVYNFHLDKGKVILDLALQHGADVVILGAFGCGAFRNNPDIVAQAYQKLVKEYDGYFEELHFAIAGEGKNYDVFAKAIGN